MKNILAIVDGAVGKKFLQRLSISKVKNQKYYIVYFDEDILPETKGDNCLLYKFDPTSFSKLSKLLRQIDFYEIFLILPNKNDFLATYENIRFFNKELKIIFLDKWELNIEDEFTIKIDANEILVNRTINFLPNIPIFAKEVGQGKGEIVEIEIPPTSNFTYKHIGALTQNRWKVAIVYRKESIHLPNDNFMLLPNDIIIAVGNPAVLQSVYRSINQDHGQFPKPYGENIYTMIDMKNISDKEINLLVNDALLLFSKLNTNKLYIRVINPTLSSSYEKLKSYKKTNIIVMIDYNNNNKTDLFLEDMKLLDIGLIVTDKKGFVEDKKLFYNSKKPIFKTSQSGFYNIKESVILSSSSNSVESISSVIFDVSTQLELNITLYEFDGVEEVENKKITEHIKSLSKLFEREINIKKLENNPLLELENKKNFLQFIEFDKNIAESNILTRIFSTELEDHFFRLSNSYQLYIPKL